MYIYFWIFFFILNSSPLFGNRPLFPAKLSSWTSAQWKNRKLGGDTPYSKALAEKAPVVTCPAESPSYDTFHEWYAACQLLPRFKMHVHNPYATALDAKLLAAETEQLLDTIQEQHKKLHWIGDTQPANTCVYFQTHAEKLIIPDDSTIAIHGDLHGDIRSLNRFIQYCSAAGYMDKDNPFKIKAKNFYILFLGDYVDRGWYGAETLYTMMRLKNANPDRVFMVRGNHEDISLNEQYGFSAELNKLKNPDLAAKIHDFYNQLPAVLYLGTHSGDGHNLIQCCHGGIEIGFDPEQILKTSHNRAGVVITDLAQETVCDHLNAPDLMTFKKYFLNKKIDAINGFMWNDFIVDPTIPFSLSDRDGKQGTMFKFGHAATHTMLNHTSTDAYKIRSIFRAHQQGEPAMRDRILNLDALSHPDDTGMGKLWIEHSLHQTTPSRLDNVEAITFSVAPDTGYGYPIHAFGLLKVAKDYKDWRLKTVRLPSTLPFVARPVRRSLGEGGRAK